MVGGGVLKILSLCFVLTTLLNHQVDSAAIPSANHGNHDGKIIARVHQVAESSKIQGQPEHHHISTEIDIPSKGIHKTIIDDSDDEHKENKDSEVRELESLKEPPNEGDSGMVMKTHSPTESGKHKEQVDLRDYNQNGKLKTAMHQTLETKENEHQQSQAETAEKRSFNADISEEENNNVDHFAAYTGVQYSPLDMAEYIFWTGDEQGVTNAIENFLKEGLMTREDAIGFLQEIKYNIEYLQAHYSGQRNHGSFEDKPQQISQTFPGEKFNHENMLKAIMEGNFERNNNLAQPLLFPQMPFNIADMNRNSFNKRNEHSFNQNNLKPAAFNNFMMDQYENEPAPTVSQEEYDEILEKLKMADFLHTENALQDIIYQLSKIMLAQSLSHGTSETQQVLQKFTNYLEIESDQGRISRSLEKKLLDVLIEALTDTLSEHPELAFMTQNNEYGNTFNNKLFSKYAENKQGSKIAATALLKDNLMKAGNVQKGNHQPTWVMNQMKNIQLQPMKRFKIAA